MGYAATTVYEAPRYIHEFLHFLEQHKCHHVKDITNKLVEQYFSHLSERKNLKHGGALSENYLRNHLRTIRWFSRYLRETTGKSFETDIHIQKTGIKPKIILTGKEIKSLYDITVDTALGGRDRAMLAVYYGCGLRKNEGVNLDLKDILFAKDMVYVRKGKNYKERYVPMPGKVKSDLQTYVTYARPALMRSGGDAAAFFLGATGKRITGSGLYERLKTLKTQAGITRPAGLHALRHSIATHLLQDGMKLEQIATFLGHSSLENTQIYTHLANGEF